MKAHIIYKRVVGHSIACSIAGLIAGLMVIPYAQADDLSDWLKFDGFGTIGTFKANDPVAGLRADSRQSTYSLNGASMAIPKPRYKRP